jgi:hypothetical protein
MNTQNLIRWAGLPAMAAGIIFAVIQPIHPPDFLPSVSTDTWVVIQSLKTVMAILFPLGIVGLYARQGKAAGWLGLAGFLLFSISWSLQLPFIFTEAFILPGLATESARFVEGFLTLANGTASPINLGALPAIYGLAGGLYLLGSLLFGIATFRAGILSRWAAGLLAAAGPLSLILVSLLPHHLERIGALPMGFAMLWLGYSLWSERRAVGTDRVTDMGNPQLYRSGVN